MHTHHIEEPASGFNAYATLLTRPSYLAGTILLSHSLHKHSSSTPLIILYTPETLSDDAVKALETEAECSNAIPFPVEHLRLPTSDDEGDGKHGMVAERFIDTWTKLRVFEILEVQGKRVKKLCFLDADMLVFTDPSPLIFNDDNDKYLAQDGNRLLATHVCVCNLDGDKWAPADWTKENCAFTSLTSDSEIAPVDPESSTKGIFNSGVFLFHPSSSIRDFVQDAFHNTPVQELRQLKFPDQDFLNTVFTGRWNSLTWRVNALKTWRYWHTNMWRDDSQVAILHYIVDKPWAARVRVNEKGEKVAGYKGDDGVTHEWWWDAFGEWKRERQGQVKLLDMVEKYVAGENGEMAEGMKAISGGGAQDFGRKWDEKKSDEKNGDEKDRPESLGQGPHGPILRKQMLGERGHGRVVRGGGRGAGFGGRANQPNINPNGMSFMEP